jgi:hypothetical protein
MANLYLALRELWQVEFSNDPDKFLHKNSGEHGLTLGGVYQVANPSQINWTFINGLLLLCGNDMKRASRMLYFDTETMEKVKGVFHNSYWSKLQLDKVESQKIANEIFLFAVVSGVKNGAKVAQKLIGVESDGVIGNVTLNALNAYDENKFDIEFDKLEIAFFENLVDNKPALSKFLRGWKNRAVLV